jgi:hypothetical protein
MSDSPVEKLPPDPFPPGTRNSFYFQFFNTASFGTILGVPMILFFKELGASVTILGVVTSLAPLLMILQIPASRHVELTGYRRFVLNGWMTRTIFGIGMVVVALLPSSIDNTTKMILTVFFLLGYNISRGISTCGFMPWICQLIPDSVRGRFLATDQMTGSLAGLISTLLVSWWIQHHPHALGFAVVFLFSTMTGFMSIRYLRKIPDVPVPAQSKSHELVPWKELLSHKPFIRIILMNIAFHIALAGCCLFWVPLLKDQFGKDSSFILSLVALGSVFSMVVQYIASSIIDRTGSKPALIFSMIMTSCHFLTWSLVAAHLIPLNFGTILLLQGLAAFGYPLYNLANIRLVMSIVPVMARSHYFAIFSVAVNLTLGIFPWIWGLGVDCLKPWNIVLWDRCHVNAYSLFYLFLIAILFGAWRLVSKIEESKAMSTEEFIEELLVNTPKQAITRLLNRRVSF